MKTRRGSNQHQSKYSSHWKVNAIIFLVIWILVISGAFVYYGFRIKNVQAQETPELISPTATPTPTVHILQVIDNAPVVYEGEFEQKQIIAYIKTIFGRDWKIACAIARSESGLRTDANNTSKIEISIWIMQINLKSEYAKVHYDRVPGKTLEEKIAWLEVPENNVLMGYWIYTKSGFNPWSVYKTGAYEAK